MDNGMLIHQMTVKGKRLSSGLEKFVSAVENGEDLRGYVYYYALGCLGGTMLSKKVMNTMWLPKVVDELASNKLIKQDKADKLKAEWMNTYKGGLEEVAEERNPAEDGKKESEQEPSAIREDELPLMTVDSRSEDSVDELPSSFVFDYNEATRKMNQDKVPSSRLGVFYDIADRFAVSKELPQTVTVANGDRWMLQGMRRIGSAPNLLTEVTYRLDTNN